MASDLPETKRTQVTCPLCPTIVLVIRFLAPRFQRATNLWDPNAIHCESEDTLAASEWRLIAAAK